MEAVTASCSCSSQQTVRSISVSWTRRRAAALVLVREHPGADIQANVGSASTRRISSWISWMHHERLGGAGRTTSWIGGMGRARALDADEVEAIRAEGQRVGAELDAGRRWWSDAGRRGSRIRLGPAGAGRQAGGARRAATRSGATCTGQGLARRPAVSWRSPSEPSPSGSRRARRRRCPPAGCASPATSGGSRTRPRTATRSASRGRGRGTRSTSSGRDGDVQPLVRQLRAAAAPYAGRLRHLRREARPDRPARRTLRVEGRGRARAGGRARAARCGRRPCGGGACARGVAVPDGLGGLAAGSRRGRCRSCRTGWERV